MKITILCENTVGERGAEMCQAEWGFSVFLETKNTNILFDTGHTGIFWENAKKLEVDIENTDFICLSHHHWDHAGGLNFHHFKNRKKLICHPDVVEKIPQNEAKKWALDFEILPQKEPFEFSKDIFFLGEIPRKNDFEKGNYEGNPMKDDSALVVKTKKGAVVISGCSHAGVCNISQYAKEITGQNLYAVIGGFHLFEQNSETVDKTVAFFTQENVQHLFPMHCVDFSVLAKLHAICGAQKYATGDTILLDIDE